MTGLPHIGARIFKSGIVVFLCTLLLPLVFKRNDVFFACIAGIMCIQNNIEESMNTGTGRVVGTIIGAFVASLFTFLSSHFSFNIILTSIAACIGVICTIYLSIAIFKIKSAVNISCVVFLAIFLNVGESLWYTYSINRTIDTFLGVIIGILVNRFMFVSSMKNSSKS